MSESSVEGGCLCGSIRYQVRGTPLSSGVCHCRSCRRAAGAPMLPYVTFPIAHFSLLKGQPAEFHSSAPVTRSFCARCGTSLSYRHADYADRIDVMTCSLDDPDKFPPTLHIWTSHKPGWVRIVDGLRAYATSVEAES
jgi:hypothetical protein